LSVYIGGGVPLGEKMTTARGTEDDELLLYMRPDEDLRERRRFRPWEGEFRLFRSPKVVKLEDHRAPGEMLTILARIRQRREACRVR
jgi:hypothetical protein